MSTKCVAWMAVALGAMLVGCDERGKTVSSTKPAPAAPAHIATSTSDSNAALAAAARAANAPATQPAELPHSTFLIGNGPHGTLVARNFPIARLHIDRDDKQVILYSDDPKNAIDARYAGNGYYISIPLTDDALAHLDNFQWHYKAISSDHQDNTDGIFLEGQRYHLQPENVTISFQGDGPVVQVTVAGTFYQFDMSQGIQEGAIVTVNGTVTATVDSAK